MPLGAGAVAARPALTVPALFTDDFNRADSGTPGGNWVEQENGADISIASNRLQFANNSNEKHISLDQDLGTVDHALECDLGNALTGSVGLLLRVPSPWAETYYFGRYTPTTGNWEMQRRVAGSFTSLATAATPDPVADFRIRFSVKTVSGNVELNLYEVIAGVPMLRLTFTDSSGSKLLTGSRVGFRTNSTGSVYVDNVAVYAA